MTFDEFLASLSRFDVDGMLAYAGQYDLGVYVNHPWFLVVMGTLAILCLLFKWRTMFAVILGLTGISKLIAYTLASGTGIDEGLKSHSLMVFIGGGLLIIIALIYLLFIRGD